MIVTPYNQRSFNFSFWFFIQPSNHILGLLHLKNEGMANKIDPKKKKKKGMPSKSIESMQGHVAFIFWSKDFILWPYKELMNIAVK